MEALNKYFLAFRKCFDYKSESNRAELNWFLLVFVVLWMLIGFSFMTVMTTCISTEKYEIMPNMVKIFIAIAGGYMITHLFPLLALIKRRLNMLFEQRAGVYFLTFLGVWFLQAAICISVFLYLMKHSEANNVFGVMPFMILAQLCGLTVLGVIIFLMFKEKD